MKQHIDNHLLEKQLDTLTLELHDGNEANGTCLVGLLSTSRNENKPCDTMHTNGTVLFFKSRGLEKRVANEQVARLF